MKIIKNLLDIRKGNSILIRYKDDTIAIEKILEKDRDSRHMKGYTIFTNNGTVKWWIASNKDKNRIGILSFGNSKEVYLLDKKEVKDTILFEELS